MGGPLGVLLLLSSIPLASAAVHNLFVSNLRGSARIHALAFDDVNNTLTKLKSFQADSTHAWIQFDNAKKNIYGSSLDVARIASYRVASSTSVELAKSIKVDGACPGTSSEYGMTSGFNIPLDTAPYLVLDASWSCGMSISVDETRTLDRVIDFWPYTNDSRVHGLALSRVAGKTFLYSADVTGDTIWTHSVNATTGKVTKVGQYKMPRAGVHPRHVAAHPAGEFAYVLTEAGNTVDLLRLDSTSHAVAADAASYKLVPDDKNSNNYWSANVMLSPSSKYLWASARLRVNSTGPGPSYISCFLLADNGLIVKRMFTVPTSADPGAALAVSPAPWSDEYAAISYYPGGDVEILKLEGRKETEDGVEYKAASAVAKLGVGDTGCCANTIWYT